MGLRGSPSRETIPFESLFFIFSSFGGADISQFIEDPTSAFPPPQAAKKSRLRMAGLHPVNCSLFMGHVLTIEFTGLRSSQRIRRF